MTRCEECNLNIPRAQLMGHLNSRQHKNNCLMEHDDIIKKISSAFKSRIATYRILNGNEANLILKIFLDEMKEKIIKLIRQEVEKFGSIKFNMEIFGEYILPAKESISIKSFNTRNRVVHHGENLNELLEDFRGKLEQKMSIFQERESGEF